MLNEKQSVNDYETGLFLKLPELTFLEKKLPPVLAPHHWGPLNWLGAPLKAATLVGAQVVLETWLDHLMRLVDVFIWL